MARKKEPSIFRLTDGRALDALAHPLRSRLIVLLRADGPATATRLGERLGESSGVTSYHLRKLAEVGLVEEIPERGTRKERWWRSAYEMTHWTPADFLDDPAAHQTSVSWRREAYRREFGLLERWLAEEHEWDKAWVDAADWSDSLLELTPAQAKAMAEEIWAVVRRYKDDPAPADAPDRARVAWLHHMIPLRGELRP